jgi:hypothetical protein
MKHSGKKTLCCGEGGGVHYKSPGLARKWGLMRQKETQGKQVVTYCAGCAHFLGRYCSTAHILDLLFSPAKTLNNNIRVARSPFTYLHRLLLKYRLKKKYGFAVTHERKTA